MKNRFKSIDIQNLTIENYKEILPESLADQVSQFIPPEGSFDDESLKRYIKVIKDFESEDPNSNMTLANRLRLAFADMNPDTICNRFPNRCLRKNGCYLRTTAENACYITETKTYLK
jgi:hypothetical protein